MPEDAESIILAEFLEGIDCRLLENKIGQMLPQCTIVIGSGKGVVKNRRI
jgi:hypothetical protein